MPIGHGRARDAGAEAIGVGERVEGEGASPAPAPPSQAFAIELRIGCKHLVNRSELIAQLHRSKVAIGRLFKLATAAAHPAIVHVEHGEAMLGEKLVKQD